MKDYLQDDGHHTRQKVYTSRPDRHVCRTIRTGRRQPTHYLYTKSNCKNYETKTTLLQLQALRVHRETKWSILPMPS